MTDLELIKRHVAKLSLGMVRNERQRGYQKALDDVSAFIETLEPEETP